MLAVVLLEQPSTFRISWNRYTVKNAQKLPSWERVNEFVVV
jgi:hypothetical protein